MTPTKHTPGQTSHDRRVEYIEKHATNSGAQRTLLFEAFLINGGWGWLSDDQLADVINNMNDNYRRHMRFCRENRKRVTQ